MIKRTYGEQSQIFENGGPRKKKIKRYSVKEFRENLKNLDVSVALQEFHDICFGQEKGHNYILEYLQIGGNCLELLQLMEAHTEVWHLILEIVYFILLEINSKYPQYISSAHEACRYFLNTYMTMTNKMLSLNSTRLERIAVLKFLTAVVALSPNFAKDVLINVNINSTNLAFLINKTDGKDDVRSAFIHFLIAFLIDGYYPTISALLEKRGLLTSILKGLAYDNAETVSMVLNTMKMHILENPSVSKTVKMRTFGTTVIKDIVKIYNWKGPVSMQKGKNRTTEVAMPVELDNDEKRKVNTSVHEFLLILCTSKFGIIFRDPQVGLGRKSHNQLVYTVLDSLESPWKHSLASELVIKICGACPDLTKTVWANLKPSLEPRQTEQWSIALNFASRLLKGLEPTCIDFCVNDLSPYQLAQITQVLAAPTHIIKILTSEEAFKDKYLKYQILKVLTESLKSLEKYLISIEQKSKAKEKYSIYNKLIEQHLKRNFPKSTILLSHYQTTTESVDDYDYLDVVFNILSTYQRICPELLDFTESSTDFKMILEYTKSIAEKDPGVLEMKIIKLYLEKEPVAFLPNSEMLEQVMPFILECYCKSQDEASYAILEKIFLNTKIFESSKSEIRIWISSLTNIKECTDTIANLFVTILNLGFEKSISYITELSDIKNSLPENTENIDVQQIIAQLCSEESAKDLKIPTIKHIYLSPLILALLEYLSDIEKDKILKSYLQYTFLNLLHSQTDSNLLLNILETYNCEFLSKKVLNYIKSWNDVNPDIYFTGSKGKLNLLSKFSTTILTGDILTFLNEHNLTYKHDILNLLDMILFYVTNMAKKGALTETLLTNCVSFIKFCNDKGIEVDVLKHPVLLHYFSPLQLEKRTSNRTLITNFILEVLRISKHSDDILNEYREKMKNSLEKMFKNPIKYKNFNSKGIVNMISILNLNPNQCLCILNLLDNFDVAFTLNDENSVSIFVHIIFCLLNSLNNFNENYEYILNQNIFEAICATLNFLIIKNKNLEISSYAKAFTTYLEIFPHSFTYITNDLFKNILLVEEHNKECIELSLLLLKKKFKDLIGDLMENIDKVVLKKGTILPMLDVLIEGKVGEDKLLIIFNKIQPIIIKTLEKPQKAGQHFKKHYKAIAYLVNKFMSVEKCTPFIRKIHKFETTEVFHVYILKNVFLNVLNKDRKYVNNAILVYIHLTMNIFKNKSKTDEDWIEFNAIFDIIKEFLDTLTNIEPDITQILQNETFKTFWKFCLKFGLSGNANLLAMVRTFVRKLRFDHENSVLMLEMIVSHSEFLELLLNEDSDSKTEILCVMYELYRCSQKIMQKHHVPILLAAYNATIRRSDRVILAILKMFEASSNQTSFYDFKPFIWGKSAANHYSVRTDIQKSLWRQPRIGSVLDILEEYWVLNTIKKYPLTIDLRNIDFDGEVISENAYTVYDLSFLLPSFSLLLSPENAIQTYRFTKSGALALTITALSSEDKEMRAAACFVLSRFYHHVEARLKGKDNQLWLRFIEAIFKGIAPLEEMKLNKFASIFLARMSLILTKPMHVMYVPLTQYLSAKSVLNFTLIPELYTLLHSSDVNANEYRNYILEIIRDGLVSADDFHVALRSVSFKLIMEQYSSVLTDTETKLQILEIVERATKLNEGAKYLCQNYGLLSWLHQVVFNLDKSQTSYLLGVLKILFNIVSCTEKIELHVISMTLCRVLERITEFNLTDDVLLIFVKVFCVVLSKSKDAVAFSCHDRYISPLCSIVNYKECKYIFDSKYAYIARKFCDLDNLNLNNDNIEYYLKYLALSFV